MPISRGTLPGHLGGNSTVRHIYFPETWSLIDTRIAARRRKDQRSSRDLNRTIKVRLREDRHRKSAKAGSAVKFLPASYPPLIREAWISMWRWYKDAVDRPPPPSRVAITTMTTERIKLYWHIPPPGERMPVGDLTFLVDNTIL